jgi:hypothetical protein
MPSLVPSLAYATPTSTSLFLSPSPNTETGTPGFIRVQAATAVFLALNRVTKEEAATAVVVLLQS